MCTVVLPPGVNPIAVNKYIISLYLTYFLNILQCKPKMKGRKQICYYIDFKFLLNSNKLH